MSRLRPPLALAAAAGTALLAGCVAAPAPAAPAAPDTIRIVNCGFEVAFPTAPERVITIKSTATEMLLALGLGDRIVGTAFQDGPVAEEWDAAAAGLVSIADKVPGEEAVLDLEPDLVYAGWESNFSPEGAGDRGELASLGVASYVSPAACQSAGQPAKLGFDEIFDEIGEVGRIFRVEDAAAALVQQQRDELAAIEKVPGDRTAFWFSSGSDTPYVGGDIGAPQLVIETAGLTNIISGVNATWTPLNWEAVVEADPDVIVLIDATWNSAGKKIAYLEGNPATAQLSAVKDRRYAIIPFPAGEAGVRSVEAAASLANQVRGLIE